MTPLPFFSSDEFLETLAARYFPGARPAYVSCEGVTVRTLLVGRRAISGFWNLSFHLQPLEPPRGIQPVPVAHLERVVVAVTGVDEPGPAGATPAPLVRWRDFPGWEQYQSFAQERSKLARFGSLERAERQMARELGPVRFVPEDPDPGLLARVIDLKRTQVDSKPGGNRYRIEQNVRYFEDLWRQGLLEGSSLRVDGAIAAGLLLHRWDKTAIGRMIAYEPSLAKYSPGLILLVRMLRQSYDLGCEEVDLLLGRQPYKMAYATHIRWLGTLGREPARDRAWRHARGQAGRIAVRAPAAYRLAKRIELGAAALVRKRGR